MPLPEGFEPLDIAARWGVDDAPDFVMHSGPIFVREDADMPQLGFEVLPHMCNPGGVCHGGMMMTVLDTGLAFILHAAMKQRVVSPSIRAATMSRVRGSRCSMMAQSPSRT